MSKCRHRLRRTEWPFENSSDPLANQNAYRFVCQLCDETLAIGDSNDGPEAVKVEMRAAEAYSRGYDGSPPFDDSSFVMLFGFANHNEGRAKVAAWPPDGIGGSLWWAGWLLRELATHGQRGARDANAWPWDPSRLVAGQFEEDESERKRESIDDHDQNPAMKFGERAQQITAHVDTVALVNGEVLDADRPAIEAHLGECEPCADALLDNMQLASQLEQVCECAGAELDAETCGGEP